MPIDRKSFFIHAYVAGIAVLGVLALISAGTQSWLQVVAEPPWLALVAFLVLGAGLEFAEHRLAMGSASGSIAFVVFISAGLSFGAFWGGLIAAGTVIIPQVSKRRPPLKIVFNAAQYVFAAVAGTSVYLALGGRIPLASLDSAMVPFLGFILVFFLVNTCAVSGAVSISEERRFSEVWMRNTWGLAAYDLVAGAFALGLAAVYVRWGVAGVAGVVVPLLFLRHTYTVNVQLQATNRELLDLMVKAIEARDPYTSGHSQRVAELARTLAKDMKLSYKDVENIRTAALLHDVGKIYEEFAPLLRKDGNLTPDEKRTMRSHPVRSADLISTISSLRGPVVGCVRHHHENFDGSGYPDGLAGRDIPIGSRIIMIADTVDAMTTDRPYRKSLSYERVIVELDKYAGTQFDPEVVEAFRRSAAARQRVGTARPRETARRVWGPGRGDRLAAR